MFKSLNFKVILFGFIFTFFSSFGQSFFLGLFNSSIRDALSITHGQFGSIYASATLLSSFILVWVGKKIDDFNILKFAAYVIALLAISCFLFSKISSDGKTENPVKFFDKFIFQFINPKGVMAGITLSSNFVEQGENYLNHSIWVIVVCSVTAFLSITSWTFLGKFLRKFATNNNFIKRFNYAMSLLLIVCIIGFYI